MKRINLRIPDHEHAALKRRLAQERLDKGARYSMNDLCVRLLTKGISRGATAKVVTHEDWPLTIPPPPPIPVLANRAYNSADIADIDVRSTFASEPNEQAKLDALEGGATADAEAEAREQFENEGGPDGNLDH